MHTQRKITGDRKVVFFDGDCHLCSGVVKWVHRLDREQEIWFASLASDFATEHRESLGLDAPGESAGTFVFWNGPAGEVAKRSQGVVDLLKALSGIWRVAGFVLGWVPRSLRDAGYRLVARNRRKWFGTVDSCALPEGSLKGRILS